MSLVCKAVLGALGWLVAGVLVGVPVGKVLRARREEMEETERRESELLARQVRLDRQGPPSWDRQDRQVRPDPLSWDRPVLRVHRGLRS